MDTIKKTILMGLGLATLAKEKADKVADDLVRQGEASRQERFKTVDSLIKKAEETEEQLSRKTTGVVREVMSNLGLPTKKDLDEVAGRLTSIEQKLSSTHEKKDG